MNLKPYLQVISIGIQNTMVYRVNFLFRAAFGLVPLTAMVMMWKTIYRDNPGQSSIATYQLPEMISYYLLVTIVASLTAATEDDWQISTDIKDGNISQFLLKPMDYFAYRFCLFLSGRIVYTVIAFLPVALFVLYYRDSLVIPKAPGTYAAFAVSLALTALLQFVTSFTMALLAFWVLEVATFIFIIFAFEYLAGGHLFPVDILPPALLQILNLTPFPYLLYFPASVYLERSTGPDLWLGLSVQAFWVVAMFALAKVIWKLGIRRYSAVGG